MNGDTALGVIHHLPPSTWGSSHLYQPSSWVPSSSVHSSKVFRVSTESKALMDAQELQIQIRPTGESSVELGRQTQQQDAHQGTQTSRPWIGTGRSFSCKSASAGGIMASPPHPVFGEMPPATRRRAASQKEYQCSEVLRGSQSLPITPQERLLPLSHSVLHHLKKYIYFYLFDCSRS